ncbi:MAG TPA: hypothetical protein VFM68_03565 [Candidatus Saccharimonadales bacterium]|nr:hypothetical protein [Candidatus Saccharimonadales bacterium]
MSKEIYREGVLANGLSYSVFGSAHNGEAKSVNDEVNLIGQDATVVVPKYNVAGVFDGAGGTTDVGSPALAALTAADATSVYFHQGGTDLHEAMQFARRAVELDFESGVCVGSLVRLHKDEASFVTAGDTGAVIYDTDTQRIPFFMEQQTDSWEPINYLGRRGVGMPDRVADVGASHAYSGKNSELYVMSDGMLGNWQQGTDLQEYHFQAAHDDYLVLQSALAKYPGLEEEIRSHLNGTRAKALREQQLADSTNSYGEGGWCSPELVDPSLFSIQKFDWAIWDEVVKPVISRLNIRPQMSAKAICSALMNRQISWEIERPHKDDASMILINPLQRP